MVKRVKRRHISSHLAVLLMAIVSIFPIAFTVANSFMSGEEVVSRYSVEVREDNQDDLISHNIHFVRFGLIPEDFTPEQYEGLLKNPEYLRMFWNSVLIAAPVLLVQFFLAPLTAYGFERAKWKGKEIVFFLYCVIMLMPTQLSLVPNYIIADFLGISESYLAIILPAMFHPLGVFLIRQQLKNFPKECLEAAALDGAGPYRAYLKIVRPNLTSVVAAMLVLLFADYWNLVDQATVFLDESFENPLSVYLGNVAVGDPGAFFATSVFYLIPALLVFLIGQRHLSEGIALSSLRS